MLSVIIYGLSVLMILGYCAIIARNPFAYILCIAAFALTIFFGLLVCSIDLISKLLPTHFKKVYECRRIRTNLSIFFCILFYFFVEVVIELICLRHASGIISTLGDVARFVFTIFLAWTLIRFRGLIRVIAGCVAFVLFIGLLSFVNSTALKSGKIAASGPLENLQSLGYVGWVSAHEDIEKKGVVRYDRELAFEGMNLYGSSTLPEAYLIDMEGDVAHKWSGEMLKDGDRRYDVHHVELCENNDLLVVLRDKALMCLDSESSIKWMEKMQFHHDVLIYDNEIYAIAAEDKLVFWHGIPVPVRGDFIIVLSLEERAIMRKVSLYDVVEDFVSPHMIMKAYLGILKPRTLMEVFYTKIKENYICRTEQCFDIMHLNRIEVIDRDIDGFCKKGDWLISFRELDLVGVLDPQIQEFVWSWGPGELDSPHYPTLLENGNVLLFDNGRDRGYTRMVELDPATKKIIWEYKAEPPDELYSEFRGCVQRLPNGNTLITESDKGHVLEVTKEGKVVWEFYNPNVETKGKKRETIYRMIRINSAQFFNLFSK